VLTPPDRVADADVLDAARTHWLDGAVAAVHLPVGFGAHHWEVADGVGCRLFVTLDALTAAPWTRGPFGEEARAAIVDRLPDVERWTRRYLALAEEAGRHRDAWVATHGEPHHANQVVVPDGLRLVDWESLALAPRERDLVDAVDSGMASVDAVGAMLELFRLDWRLFEISDYAAWFRGPHGRSSDDRAALGGLYEELRG
jgi:spectinomycin phosphotransferase